MRYKIVMEVDANVSGNVLPISYQYELSAGINRLLTADKAAYEEWLSQNNLTPESNLRMKVYSTSNLYIPKIYVENDRLFINAPRVQFWLSFLPEVGTTEYLHHCFDNQPLLLGDRISRVQFHISDVSVVSPVIYSETMDYQTLSPLVVLGMRPNNTVEYLHPHSEYFREFIIDELIERYELYYGKPYEGSRECSMTMLDRERRKAVTIHAFTTRQQKVVGYMLKMRVTMDPELQRFAYDAGLGNRINFGFGYIELMQKKREAPDAEPAASPATGEATSYSKVSEISNN